jgi:hypothetical protein
MGAKTSKSSTSALEPLSVLDSLKFPNGLRFVVVIMFDAPDELLWSPTMEPPNGTEAVMSTTSPDQVWWFVSVPIMIIIPAIFVAIRFYAKLRIVRKFDPADCEHLSIMV